ncbi:pyridoxamine 5'-phosphate oxidase-domain-containing protein [Suillus bovinus]|uniref:pyridoxamine 5'-phosphate oxidase-domain-containing protein n=1 Tax=Suillus bovinus TaxID=48563 RepID=UPI001B87C4A8|nr:pyridoxamine 5'-phosphate oxidase-domain-containing protein [Suillus bovinus]KAG2153566.1 pyridoxamine 5'-phosphate oxidase-domain-containing protein [Suillus bovinus]
MAARSARWHNALKLALQSEEGVKNVFQLATTNANNTAPHVRSHIIRDHIIHPYFPSLPLLLTTTDIRTPKVTQIESNPNHRVEALFWIKATNEQFRVSGRAAIYPSPELQENKGIEGVGEVYDAFRSQGWDWERERQRQFDNVGAHMRASWCRPVPGSPMESYSDAEKWPVKVAKPGEEGYDAKNYEQARGNFALVLIDPIEVDYIELGVMPNRRTKFVKQDSGDERWKEVILVP